MSAGAAILMSDTRKIPSDERLKCGYDLGITCKSSYMLLGWNALHDGLDTKIETAPSLLLFALSH